MGWYHYGLWGHIRKISQIDSVSARWEEIHGRAPNEDDVDEMFADFVPLQLACLADYSDLILGTLEAISDFQARGLEIGSTTGYLPEMMVMLKEEASQHGYVPDSSVCAGDVPAGRPEPWMCLENAKNLGVYPMESIVKVDDTLPGIEEGLNVGMWSIGLAKTGNEVGLNQEEIEALSADELRIKLEGAYQRMWQVGAHYVVDGIWDVPMVLDLIGERLSRGGHP